MPDLVVSVNHVAALRQGHNDKHPDPAAAAVLAELAGAVGIAVRFTGDRRYVNDRDIRVLREIVKGRFILGMAPTSEMMGMALDVKPDEVILIPEHPEEATPSGGLDLILDRAEINDTIATIRDSGIPVFLLIDPDPDHIKIAHRSNVDGVQIHTAAYVGDALPSTRKRLLARLVDAAKIAVKLKLRVAAGSGLGYTTARAVGQLSEVETCIIGHSIMARALMVGIETAVREMIILLEDQ
jgi:pyridoxine 5-phosphate synthase